MRGTFDKGLKELRDKNHGHVTGSVEVDQVYSHYQHEHPEFKHPRGGKAFFLRDPLYQHGPGEYLRHLADRAYTEGVAHAMISNMEHLSLEVYTQAPWEFGDLRASGHPKVEVDGHVTYDRAPNVARLSEEDLRIKSRLRSLFKGVWT